jgi:hypothetical protein
VKEGASVGSLASGGQPTVSTEQIILKGERERERAVTSAGRGWGGGEGKPYFKVLSRVREARGAEPTEVGVATKGSV